MWVAFHNRYSDTPNRASRGGATMADNSDAQARFNTGCALLQQRQLGPALAALADAARLRPQWPQASYQLGVALLMSGRPLDAARALEQSLRFKHDYVEAHVALGKALQMLQRVPQAVDHLQKALAIQPDNIEPLLDLALLCQQQDQTQRALELAQRAAVLRPADPNLQNTIGTLLLSWQRPGEAAECFRRSLAVLPNEPATLFQLANCLRTEGSLNDALDLYRRAAALRPAEPGFHSALASCLDALGLKDEAVESYRRAVQIQPERADLQYNLGVAYARAGDHAQAVTALRQCVALNPNDFRSWANLGGSLYEVRESEEALHAFQRALALNPNEAVLHNNLGNALRRLNHHQEAESAYTRAIELEPMHPGLRTSLASLWLAQGRAGESIHVYREAFAMGALSPAAHSDFLLGLHYLPNQDPAKVFEEHLQWARFHAPDASAATVAHSNDRSPDRRLRIGYVSPDFRSQSVGFFMEPILSAYDHAAFEVTCYSDVAKPDAMTARLRSYVDRWRETARWSDQQLTDAVRADEIDIFVDLAGHTGLNRLPAFARKPAPVQVTYLGYADTTGLKTIDYRITDQYADPPGASECYHTEKLIRPFTSAWCYQPPAETPPVAPLPSLTAGRITIGSFSIPAKLNAQLASFWSQVILALPRSRLLLKYHHYEDPTVRRRVQELFTACGIEPDRIEFLGRAPTHREHLQTYDRVDLSLDTFPYHGTTTTCEALWMGVPVITLAGDTHLSRVGVSLLTNAGLGELIARSPDEFVRIAIDLASDRARLAELRAGCRKALSASPLTDREGFIRSLERAYRQLWHRRCAPGPSATGA